MANQSLIVALVVGGVFAGCGGSPIGGPPVGRSAAVCDQTYESVLLPVCTDPDIPQDTGAGFDDQGTVTHWGTGFEGCLMTYGSSGVPASSAHLLTVKTSTGKEQSFAFLLEGVDPVVKQGDSVHVSYAVAGIGFGPVYGSFQMDGAAGLMFYVGVGFKPDDMNFPAGVTMRRDSQVCAYHDLCGDSGRYAVSVDVPGSSALVSPRVPARVGSYLVNLVESAGQIGPTTCQDGGGDYTVLAITP